MSYNYLLELYKNLDRRIQQIEKESAASSQTFEENEEAYRRGRCDCLRELKTFLQDNFHQKLPGRIRRLL